MHKAKRILCLGLCIALLCGGMMIPAGAASYERPPAALRLLYEAGDFALRALAWGIGWVIPAKIPAIDERDFYPGTESFITEPQGEDPGWYLGYAKASLLYEGLFDPVTKEYIGPNDLYVGGAPGGEEMRDIIDRKNPLRLVDDQAVRATALSDGPKGHGNRGIAVFASVDCYALTSYDVRAIRALLRDFAAANNVVSINIGTLHQHSCIDTLGINGPLLLALPLNPIAVWTGLFPPFSGRNEIFMKNLHETVAATIREAVGNMERGTLRYGFTDVTENVVDDRRKPFVTDTEMHRLRFVPDEPGSKETWLVNLSAHCTHLGATTRHISGDYPTYMEEMIGQRANFQMFLGAELAVYSVTGHMWGPGKTSMDIMREYGRVMGQKLIDMGGEDEALAPILNVRSVTYTMPVDNPIHLVAFSLGLIKSTGQKRYRIGPSLDLLTETGYMELGDNLAIAFGPGEIDPTLVYGGEFTAQEAWRGWEYKFTPMKAMVGSRKLLMFGLMNDHSGYYILPNDIRQFVLFENEEINAASTKAAPLLLEAFARAAGYEEES